MIHDLTLLPQAWPTPLITLYLILSTFPPIPQLWLLLSYILSGSGIQLRGKNTIMVAEEIQVGKHSLQIFPLRNNFLR